MRGKCLLLVTILLAGCDWWPEQLGGRQRPDRIAQRPLSPQLLREFGWTGYPPLATLGPDGLRVFVAPSFGDYRYLVDFSPQPRGCYMVPGSGEIDEAQWRNEGCVLIAVRLIRITNTHERPDATRAQTYRFVVPEEDFRDVVGTFDQSAARWSGGGAMNLDGTSVDIERVRGGVVTSMSTNALRGQSPGNPGAQLLLDVQRLALAYGPTGVIPRSYDWNVSSEPDYPCTRGDLNVPDSDGFGTGSDLCAQFIAEHPLPTNRRRAVPSP
jgi:hypothetical protein